MKKGNKLSEIIIGKAIEVHRELGPGLLESAYQKCLVYELRQAGLLVEEEKSLPLTYKNVRLELGLLINFQVPLLKNGIKRVVNNF